MCLTYRRVVEEWLYRCDTITEPECYVTIVPHAQGHMSVLSICPSEALCAPLRGVAPLSGASPYYLPAVPLQGLWRLRVIHRFIHIVDNRG